MLVDNELEVVRKLAACDTSPTRTGSERHDV
jgi:hypothetical protein